MVNSAFDVTDLDLTLAIAIFPLLYQPLWQHHHKLVNETDLSKTKNMRGTKAIGHALPSSNQGLL
jgi:hypothetical protein